MKFALLLAFLAPGFAWAQDSYECVPALPSEVVAKAVIRDLRGSYEIEMWGPKGSIVKTAAEYSDDIDTVSYYSETADLDIYFYWTDMQRHGEADGQITVDATGPGRKIIQVICKSLP